AKNESINLLSGIYSEEIFRKLRWYSYINKQRAQQQIVNKIKETYGEDVILVIGDWSTRGIHNKLKNNKPTPNLGLTRLLAKNFELYLIDEYNTSKLDYLNEQEAGNLMVEEKYAPRKKRKKKKEDE